MPVLCSDGEIMRCSNGDIALNCFCDCYLDTRKGLYVFFSMLYLSSPVYIVDEIDPETGFDVNRFYYVQPSALTLTSSVDSLTISIAGGIYDVAEYSRDRERISYSYEKYIRVASTNDLITAVLTFGSAPTVSPPLFLLGQHAWATGSAMSDAISGLGPLMPGDDPLYGYAACSLPCWIYYYCPKHVIHLYESDGPLSGSFRFEPDDYEAKIGHPFTICNLYDDLGSDFHDDLGSDFHDDLGSDFFDADGVKTIKASVYNPSNCYLDFNALYAVLAVSKVHVRSAPQLDNLDGPEFDVTTSVDTQHIVTGSFEPDEDFKVYLVRLDHIHDQVRLRLSLPPSLSSTVDPSDCFVNVRCIDVTDTCDSDNGRARFCPIQGGWDGELSIGEWHTNAALSGDIVDDPDCVYGGLDEPVAPSSLMSAGTVWDDDVLIPVDDSAVISAASSSVPVPLYDQMVELRKNICSSCANMHVSDGMQVCSIWGKPVEEGIRRWRRCPIGAWKDSVLANRIRYV